MCSNCGKLLCGRVPNFGDKDRCRVSERHRLNLATSNKDLSVRKNYRSWESVISNSGLFQEEKREKFRDIERAWSNRVQGGNGTVCKRNLNEHVKRSSIILTNTIAKCSRVVH